MEYICCMGCGYHTGDNDGVGDARRKVEADGGSINPPECPDCGSNNLKEY